MAADDVLCPVCRSHGERAPLERDAHGVPVCAECGWRGDEAYREAYRV